MAKIGVILGSIRQGRVGEHVAQWVMETARGRDGADYELLDLTEFNVPLLTAPTPPAMAAKNYDDAAVTAWSKAVDACDGFIFVTAEFNHSVPGAFKNAVDSLGPEWTRKPVAFVGYGAEGASRAVEHWRQIIANFSMFGVRNQVSLSFAGDFSADGFTPREVKNSDLERVLGDIELEVASR
ncbi:NADPH-dependent FMN reductase [Corynebacterium sp. LK2510]|uniref:NADPH-dependent FMN reductase n=1 Tax=Corynebacterium sp. LK2510 TaxID=3110472 RepID=UPI0034CFF4F7